MIPTPESVDNAFLTRILQEAGHPGAVVRGFTSEQIGTGQIGKCIRYSLELAQDIDGVPRSLVGKFASDDSQSRTTGVQLHNYLKEVNFYRELRPRLRISTPRCYYAEIVGDGPEFALFLEDLSPAEQGDQLGGCSPEIARAAVLELVGLHAPSWCDASLRGIDWIGEPSPPSNQIIRAIYNANLPGFMERFGASLEADQREIIQRLGSVESGPFGLLRDPFSLVHVDYRLDNLLIDATSTPPRVTTVDWQTITLGSPLADVAYFIGAGLLPEDRRKIERDLVREYHAALGLAGVSDYAWNDCWEDYRRGTFAGIGMTVIAALLVVQTERGDEMFTAMAQRHSRHALDLGAGEFL
ncbi:MAG: phosphotransferase [Deltaproteobacteria bacterium]|nr:phosphotransferase [Deltaproteobacteria bacterium]MBW2396091.1 phosphotransferase [Deltaproteobacteria bacterium]